MKKLLIGTTALAIAGASFAYAQQPPRGPDRQQWRPSAEDISAFTDARIAGLKAGLKLTPDQEKNWPAVETALRDLAKQRADRMAARASAKTDDKPGAEKRDPIERLRYRADLMSETGANLKKLADAAAPLYQSLDESQKHRFQMLAQLGMRDFGRNEHRHGGRHGHHHGFGFDRFERGGPQGDGPRGPRGDGPRPQ
jgi:hypothetical protein